MDIKLHILENSESPEGNRVALAGKEIAPLKLHGRYCYYHLFTQHIFDILIWVFVW